MQSAPGTYVRIRVPGLQNLSNRIIHRAELIAEQVPDDNNIMTLDRYFQSPRLLLLSAFDSAKNQKRNIPNDYIVGSSGPNTVDFGGFRTFKTINGYDRVAAYILLSADMFKVLLHAKILHLRCVYQHLQTIH